MRAQRAYEGYFIAEPDGAYLHDLARDFECEFEEAFLEKDEQGTHTFGQPLNMESVHQAHVDDLVSLAAVQNEKTLLQQKRAQLFSALESEEKKLEKAREELLCVEETVMHAAAVVDKCQNNEEEDETGIEESYYNSNYNYSGESQSVLVQSFFRKCPR
eukprot:GSA25T00021433001.1